MQVRIKYRLRFLDKPTLQPGQVVELDEDEAREFIRQGVAESLDAATLLCGDDLVSLRVSLAAKEAELDAAEKEVLTLRDEKAVLEKQVATLKEALKKAKDRGKSSPGPEGGAPAPDSPQAGRQDRAPADMHTPEGG